jgi:Domain of unknown function (DUF6457)
MAPSAEEWIARFAEALGRPAPGEDEMEAILELAAVAAHSSERKAAPIACWLAAGRDLSEAQRIAESLSEAPPRPERAPPDR